jgi:hypothetical protein
MCVGYRVVRFPEHPDPVTRSCRFHKIIVARVLVPVCTAAVLPFEKEISSRGRESDMLLPGSKRKIMISGRINKARRRK